MSGLFVCHQLPVTPKNLLHTLGVEVIPLDANAANTAVTAFMKVYYIVAALGKPAALIAGVIGAIRYSTGDPHGGIKAIKQAGFGFMLVWVMPGLMRIVEEVGRSIA
jgi:hypothetical protein